MEYKIIVDSCVDFQSPTDESQVERIPFTVNIDDQPLTDQGDQVKGHLSKIGFLAKTIRTACPSPGDFIDALEGAKKAFIVTISSHLSGAHAAAVAAREQLRERLGGSCDVHIIDSESASAGETLVVMKLQQLIAQNLPMAGIAERLNQYVSSLRTLFVLDSMDTLVANGRVKPIQGVAMKALKIFPIMGEDGHGKIELKSMVRGKGKALQKLIDMIGENAQDLRERVLGITHVNAPEKALELKAAIEARYAFKDVVIFEASGLSSVYASDGGIVLAY